MKKEEKKSVSKRLSYFFKHYFGLLLLAVVCGVLTVLLVTYCV